MVLCLVARFAGTYLSVLDRVSAIAGVLAFSYVFTWRLQLRSRLAVLALIAYGIYCSLSFVAQSDEAMRDLIARYQGFAILHSQTKWIPYETFFR